MGKATGIWEFPYSVRVLLALVGGLFSGLFFAAIATFFVLIRGVEVLTGPGLTYMQAMNVYLLGGLAAGVVLALFHPLMRYRVGALLVGAVAYAPMTAGFMLFLYGPPTQWTLENILAAIPAAIAIGGGVGAGIWEVTHKEAAGDSGST